MMFFKNLPDARIPLRDRLRGVSVLSISFDRLNPGVDNVRYDVHLSPKFCAIASKLIFQQLVLAAQAQDRVDAGNKSEYADLPTAFRQACRDVLLSGIRLAKDFKENQIDMLAQVAVYKFLIQEIRVQFEALCTHFRKSIRETERPHAFNAKENVRLKQALSDIVKNRQNLFYVVSKALFRWIREIQRDPLEKYRESTFGRDASIPENVFDNPLLFVDGSPDDAFMIAEYLLFGHRHEDTNRYEALIGLVKDLLMMCDAEAGENEDPRFSEALPRLLDEWIGDPTHIRQLFNAQASLDRLAELKGLGHPKDALSHWKQQAAAQKRLLKFFYRRFQKRKLIPIICASYEIQPVFSDYCPPLSPQAVLQFPVNPRSRNATLDRLKRLSKAENRQYSAEGLWQMTKRIRRLRRRQKEAYLRRYLEDLSRYHRDRKNAERARKAMDAVHLAADEKTLNLSRVNNLLYAFLLPEEETGDLSPIVNHVVLKADVRGSTEIVRQMKNKGLTPASFFSLNFFEPINTLLDAYDAEKVFIEGDAIILTLLERAKPAKHLFTMARACGLAMDILSVVQRCNARSRKAGLPVIEIGIGISFQTGPPAYLFDGERRIMISPAINQAHFLCRSDMHRTGGGEKPQFNVAVFEAGTRGRQKAAVETPPMIYNVNGIAIDSGGFRKLSREIELKTVESRVPEIAPHRLRLHVGNYLTPLGIKRTLVIREAPLIVPDSLPGAGVADSEHVYYEVCTYPAILAWAEKRSL